MPPKVKYSRTDVIEAAFTIVEQNGLSRLTARSVADRLGSSTAPVYRYFENMDDLALEVMKKTKSLLLDYATRPYTKRVFLNMGTGIALFACHNKQLYRALWLGDDSFRGIIDEFTRTMESKMVDDDRLVTLSQEERRVLLNKMWTYTHGLASLICTGIIKDCSQEFIITNLMDVGADVIGSTLMKHESKNKGK